MPDDILTGREAGAVDVAASLASTDTILVSVGGVLRRVSRDALLSFLEAAPTNTRVVNLPSRLAVLSFAATPPAIGTLASHPGAAYRYVGSGAEIPDLPGWEPEGFVTPQHYGADPTGVASAVAAIVAADAFVAAHPGRALLFDQVYGLDAPVMLTAPAIWGAGTLRVMPTFNPGTANYVFRIGAGQAGVERRAAIDLFVQGEDYFGPAAGTWNAGSGTFPSTKIESGVTTGIVAGDSFACSGAGTVDGQSFTGGLYGNRLVALVDNPSTTTFADNWAKRAQIAAVHSEGLTSGLAAISVRCDACDIGLRIAGNSERTSYVVGATRCHTAAFERENADGSPDNNRLLIKAWKCGRFYAADGKVVSNISFDCQGQVEGYLVYPVLLSGERKSIVGGTLRGTGYGAILIVQDASVGGTGIVFDDLLIVDPEGTVPWLDATTRTIEGMISVTKPNRGALIRSADGGVLTLVVDGQKGGAVLTLGAGSTSAARMRLRLSAVSHDGATAMLNIVDGRQSMVEVTGNPLPVTVASGAGGREVLLRLPGRYLIDNVSVVNNEAAVEFGSGASRSQVLAYSTPAAGMICQDVLMGSGDRAYARYTGSAWQAATMTAL